MTPDSLSSKYDEFCRHDPFRDSVRPTTVDGYPRDRYQALVYLARRGGRLLEIGCGRGEVLLALAPHFEAVVGTELSPERAEYTRRALSALPNCDIVAAEIDALPAMFDTPFDCIIWADVIEHVVDVIGAMRTLAQLSHPGTQLVTVTPNVGFLPQRWNILRGRAPSTHSGTPKEGFRTDPAQTLLLDGGHLHYFSFRQMEQLYRIAGFRPEKRLGFGSRLGRWSNLLPTLFSSSVCVSGTYERSGE